MIHGVKGQGKARRPRVTGTDTKERGIVTGSAVTEKSTTESEKGSGATERRNVITTKTVVVHTATEVGKTRKSKKPMNFGLSWALHHFGLREKDVCLNLLVVDVVSLNQA